MKINFFCVMMLISTSLIFQSCEKEEEGPNQVNTFQKSKNINSKTTSFRIVKDCWLIAADGGKGKQGVSCSVFSRGHCKPDKNGCDTSGNEAFEDYFSPEELALWGNGLLDTINDEFVYNHWDFF
ncbi:MAG: hypothetical protein JKY48_14590 [Flavobacteriales bacterium]|nr:hypothetical protein [Flavobacteriales bacterium]